jgi:hypothetical protein
VGGIGHQWEVKNPISITEAQHRSVGASRTGCAVPLDFSMKSINESVKFDEIISE